jgi:AAA+ superfamily predicted ATPase
MEKSIRELFEKIKRLQPCVVYVKNMDAIAASEDEHLHGAILELLEYLTEFSDNNKEVFLLCSVTRDIHQQIEKYFGERI